MGIKFLIFVAVSVLLGSAMYVSSSTYYISAAKSRSCSDSVSNDGKFRIETCCDVETDEKGNILEVTNCETTVCPIGGVICAEEIESGEPPLGENDRKVPKADVLPDRNLPPSTSDDDDTNVPKGPGGLNNDDDAPTINPGLP